MIGAQSIPHLAKGFYKMGRGVRNRRNWVSLRVLLHLFSMTQDFLLLKLLFCYANRAITVAKSNQNNRIIISLIWATVTKMVFYILII